MQHETLKQMANAVLRDWKQKDVETHDYPRGDGTLIQQWQVAGEQTVLMTILYAKPPEGEAYMKEIIYPKLWLH